MIFLRAILIFASPAASIDVERLFSIGWILLNHLCNRLSADSTHAILCLKSWWDAGILNDELFMFGTLPPEEAHALPHVILQN